MPPNIPPELYSLFLDQIALEKDIKLRTKTLKACSLASRTLNCQARRYLFYRIKLQPKINAEDAKNSIQHFCQLLEGNPPSDFISYLRVLEIGLKPCVGMMNPISGLPAILNILCANERRPLRLHTLKMDMRRAEWRGLSEDLRASLYRAVSCRHLEGSAVPTSGLKRLEFFSLKKISLSFFVQCTQTVKQLRFNECSFDHSLSSIPPLSSDAHPACNPHLRLEVYRSLQGFSECLQGILDSPAASILTRIKHLAIGYLAFNHEARMLPSILLVTKGHLEALELRKVYPSMVGILGMIGPINLTLHHQLRHLIIELLTPIGVLSFGVFELETNDPTSIEDIEIQIQHTARHSWQEDLGMVADPGQSWKNLGDVLSGPRYPFLRKVDITVFLERPSISQPPAVSVQTLIVQELRALLSNLTASGRIQLGVVVELVNMPRY